jgi:hypothetical protein
MCRGAAANAKEGCEQLAKRTAITNGKTNNKSSHRLNIHSAADMRFQGIAGQKNDEVEEIKKGPRKQLLRSPADHSSALAWLSLIGVLASRARLRFTKQQKHTPQKTKPNRFERKTYARTEKTRPQKLLETAS